MRTIEERELILDKEIFKLVNHGWKLAHRSDTKCLLTKPKKAKDYILIFLLLLFIVPGVIYLLMPKGESTIKIEITEEGDIKCFTTGLTLFDTNEMESYL